ncbi:MAG: nucleotide exchange factor GrpE [Planctomycetota bacterium]
MNNESAQSETEHDAATPENSAGTREEGAAAPLETPDPVDAVFEGDDVTPPPTRDEEMERLRRTADEADKRVLMAQAEAENFRKRMRRDLEDQLKFAAMPLVSDILQVRDNLLRAVEAAQGGPSAAGGDAAASDGNTSDGNTGDGNTGGLREGVQIVIKLLDDSLAKHGITQIPAEGVAFDPNVHEAISQVPSPDHESGAIVHVAAAGFKMHDRVIRPSQVVVAQ